MCKNYLGRIDQLLEDYSGIEAVALGCIRRKIEAAKPFETKIMISKNFSKETVFLLSRAIDSNLSVAEEGDYYIIRGFC